MYKNITYFAFNSTFEQTTELTRKHFSPKQDTHFSFNDGKKLMAKKNSK